MVTQPPNHNRRRYLRKEYIARINRVIDHIESNLDSPLNLEALAGVANFSPYHFHRIFRAILGETLSHFIQRIRLEKAAAQLVANPKKSITAIALDCGFSGSATFARAFKTAFGISASRWRDGEQPQKSKIRKTNRKMEQAISKFRKDMDMNLFYSDPETNNPKQIWRIAMKGKSTISVEVKNLPKMNVAYVRHIGSYQGDSKLFERLINKLMTWAGPRDLIRFPETQLLAVYHDDPNITAADNLRTSICITVPPETKVDGDVGKMSIPGGRYAVARVEVAQDEFQGAWDALFGGWLPESGYQPDDRPCYEIYRNDPKQHPEGKHITDICIPVKPL
jgi:AraC family transcriptional regulator